MKKITLSLFSLAVLTFTAQMTAQVAENVTEYNPNPTEVSGEIQDFSNNNQTMGVVIYSNGPYFNVAGGGFGGADLSLLENLSVGNTTLGNNHSTSGGFRLADDWVVTETVEVTSIDFYAYQTGSTTTSTFLGGTIVVWDGEPGVGTVIYGDDAISAMVNTEWSGAYRASESTPQNADRPIMRNTLETPGLVLTPGTYWIDWDADGSLASGPWAPPIAAPLGTGASGNGKIFSGGAWGDVLDGGSGNPLGFPFDVTGTVLSLVENSFEGFSYYPNPTTDILNVSAKSNIENITLFNVLGQQLISVTPDSLSAKVDIANLSAGMYVMKATVNGTVGSFNIVKR
ncbi:MAG: T9SS type A sorting domain-containing protein [Flavobacteriaceae bacterium]